MVESLRMLGLNLLYDQPKLKSGTLATIVRAVLW